LRASVHSIPYSLPPSLTVFFLFGTRRRIPIEKRLVKVESEEDLDKDRGAIGTIEFLQKGRIHSSQNNYKHCQK
jgi:hypothetical protein